MSTKVRQALVSPGYLAGPGDPGWVTAALHTSAGWSHGQDPLVPRVILTSPDQKSLLRLEPVIGEPWWRLSHRNGRTGSAWEASFDGATPVELIAAVTDALSHPDYDERETADSHTVLVRAGWYVSGDDFRSPDRCVRGARHLFPGSTDWRVTASLYEDLPVWNARFSSSTPRVLVAAFLQALADPAPVLRRYEQPVNLVRSQVTLRWLEQPPEDVARRLPERIERLAAPRPNPPAPPAPSAVPPPAPSTRRRPH
ncbi:DUF317 domain-containing protein [Streptomyces sp. NPDC093249]|uniref:DUF317 domain-containing protein n=1 Tax=unclassified Streptomyces TaxID=2593676 RepID=UPI00344F5F69